MALNKYDQQDLGMAGCYALNQPNNPPLELPLKNFTYDIQIVDSFAQVTLTQIYLNPQQRALDVQYVFPVHPNATVNRLQVEFGGQRNTGLVMEKQEAKKQFERQMSEGAGAAYGEYNSQNRDIMRLMVGNIAAKQEVKVTLTYIHANSLVNNTFYQYRLASTMTPRYARGLQLSQIMFNSFGNSHTVEGKCSWSVNMTIRSSRNIQKVESNTHQLKKIPYGNENIYTFAEPNVLPDRDFSLYYTLDNYTKPLYSISHSDNNTTAAISFIPKYCTLSQDDAYKQHLKGKSFQVELDATRGEYIFLLDRSGSMDGIRIENAKRALEVFLRSLPEDSFFNVLSFGSSFKYLFQDSPKNTKENVQEAVQKISQMEADMGGTQILGAIKSLVRRQVIKGYPRQLFFLTDGAVSNVTDVLRYISRHTQYTRVNSIGIGNGLSQHLIRGSAQKGKGYSIFIEDNEQPQKKIISMLQNTLSPVISNINFECDRTKVDSIVPNPDKTPYILKNDIATFYITFNGKLLEPFEVNISYKDTLGNTYSQKLVINPNAESVNCKWLHHYVNSQKIQALSDSYDYGQNKEDRIYYVKSLNKEKLKDQIIRQSIKHQILTQHTAFLCIDANAVDSIKKQNLSNQKIKANIKGMNPYDHVVNFVNEADQQDQQGEYINECGIMEYELPLEELKKIAKFQEFTKTPREPMKMGMRVAGQAQPKLFPGVIYLPQPEKKNPLGYIIKQQDSNGAWKNDFLDSLFVDASGLKEKFKIKTDMTSIITFLVCKYLDRFLYKQQQYSLIIKKGRNYVDKNSRINYREMDSIFHTFYALLQV